MAAGIGYGPPVPKVTFLNENVTFEVEPGVTIQKVAEEHGINLFRGIWQGASCKNWGSLSGWCGRCSVWQRAADLKPDPLGGVKSAPGTAKVNACTAKVTADIEVRTRPGFEHSPPTTLGWDQDPRPSKWKERLVKAKAAGAAAAADEAEDESAEG